MARGPGRGDNTAGRIVDVLDGHARGMHRLGAPAFLLDTELPEPLAAVYRCADGAELFHETVTLVPSAQVERMAQGPGGEPCVRVGEIAGDELCVDAHGRVFRQEADTGEWLDEGTRFDRWLLGMVEAEELLYDRDGEFRDDMFDEAGELLAEVSERVQRRVLRRDRHAPAPRWRLAQALLKQGQVERARDELERVVEDCPGFAWAWFDLARISEELGELDTAVDEYVAAAEARPGYEHAGYFFAHAARVAAALGGGTGQARRAELAARALALDPDLVNAQRQGAQAMLDEGDARAALQLAELAAALAPKDLTLLDLLARIRAQLDSQPPSPG